MPTPSVDAPDGEYIYWSNEENPIGRIHSPSRARAGALRPFRAWLVLGLFYAAFMRNDTGGDFVTFNSLDFRDKPTPVDGTASSSGTPLTGRSKVMRPPAHWTHPPRM
jgi:hypothetical protein